MWKWLVILFFCFISFFKSLYVKFTDERDCKKKKIGCKILSCIDVYSLAKRKRQQYISYKKKRKKKRQQYSSSTYDYFAFVFLIYIILVEKIGNQLAYTQLIKDHFTYCCFEILAPHSKVPTTTSCIAWSLH